MVRRPSMFPWYAGPYIQLTMNLSSSLSQGFNWLALVRVDGVIYSFVDYGSQFFNDTVNLTNVVVTPTQTIVAAQAGPMQVNLTFLNPIEVRFHSSVTFNVLHMHRLKPRDWVKQSIPFSYIAFTARSLDGTSHAVQVYSHIGGRTCNRFETCRLSPALLQSGTPV